MENFKLKRGNSSIELQKTDNLIAIRPSDQAYLDSTLKSLHKEDMVENTDIDLGGFHLISVSKGQHEKTLDTLRSKPFVDAGSHVYTTPASEIPFVPNGKIAIRFNDESTPEQQNEILDKYYLQILSSRSKDNSDGSKTITYITSVTKNSPNPLKVAAELQASDIIKIAEPDLATPGKLKAIDDYLLPEQWHLSNQGILPDGTSLGLKKGADANVFKAWKILDSLGSPKCIIAIIDDGFDISHPDLNIPDKIFAPWDFKSNTSNPRPKIYHPQKGDWHGTSCAGVALGAANGTGIVGAAPDCKLMPVRWGGDLSDDSIEDWFGYVTYNGADVVSCSWGAAASYYPLSFRQIEAIEDCATRGRNGRGCVIVFAAGNDNHDIKDPHAQTEDGFATHPNVICVSASTSRDMKADYSNYGNEVSVCAPSSGSGGRGIVTADVTGTYKSGGNTIYAGYAPGDYTKSFGGTSSATPLVAGVCALVLTANPDLKAEEVREILERSARKIGKPSDYQNGHSVYFGYGCVDAASAVLLARQGI